MWYFVQEVLGNKYSQQAANKIVYPCIHTTAFGGRTLRPKSASLSATADEHMLLDTAATPLSTRSDPETSPGGKAAQRGTAAAAMACPQLGTRLVSKGGAPPPASTNGLLPALGAFPAAGTSNL